MKRLLLLLAFSIPASAQLGNVTLLHFAGVPTGACTSNQQAVNDATGDLYTCLTGSWHAAGTSTGTGTLTNFSAGTGAPLFTTNVATPTTTPALTFTASNAAANTVFGNFTGAPAAPTFTAAPTFSAANLTNFPTFNQNTTGTAAALTATPTNCGAGSAAIGILANGNATGCFTPSGAGTVTTFSAGNLSPLFTSSVATATSTPALTFTLSTPAANTVFGNFTGAPAAPTFTAAPTFSAANLTSFPTFNQNTSGTAANLSGTPALPNGTAATTQAVGDSTTKIASDAFVLANSVGRGVLVDTFGADPTGVTDSLAAFQSAHNFFNGANAGTIYGCGTYKLSDRFVITNPGIKFVSGCGTSGSNLGGAADSEGGFVLKGSGSSQVIPVQTAGPTLSASITGGSLAAGTYHLKTTSLNGFGETTVSPDATATVASGIAGSVTVSSVQYQEGGFAFNLYCSTSGTGGTYFLVPQADFANSGTLTGPPFIIAGQPTAPVVQVCPVSGTTPPVSNTSSHAQTLVEVGSNTTDLNAGAVFENVSFKGDGNLGAGLVVVNAQRTTCLHCNWDGFTASGSAMGGNTPYEQGGIAVASLNVLGTSTSNFTSLIDPEFTNNTLALLAASSDISVTNGDFEVPSGGVGIDYPVGNIRMNGTHFAPIGSSPGPLAFIVDRGTNASGHYGGMFNVKMEQLNNPTQGPGIKIQQSHNLVVNLQCSATGSLAATSCVTLDSGSTGNSFTISPQLSTVGYSDGTTAYKDLAGSNCFTVSGTGAGCTVAGQTGLTALLNGTTATTQSVADNTTKVATDAFVLANAATNPMTTIGDMIGGGASGAATRIVGGKTGQIPVATNGATPAFSSPGIADGNAAAHVTTTPYAIACDSSTAVLDRATTIVFDSGASVVTLPDHTATGCGGSMVFTLVNESGSTLTVNCGGTDTLNVTGTQAKSIAATSFTMADSANASINNGEAGIWNARLTGPASGSLSGMTASQVPIAATASTVTSSEALAGAGAGITTGPTSSTTLDVTEFTGTGGQIADSGVAVANLTQTTATPAANQICVYGSTAKTCTPTTTLPTAAEPAHTGDVTNSAGSLASTIANNAVTQTKVTNGYVDLSSNQSVAGNKTLSGVTTVASIQFPEGTAVSASAGNDIIYADSTAHALLGSYNNGSFSKVPLVGITNTFTPLQTFTAGVATGSTPPACTAGTAGFMCNTEGTAPTNVASTDVIYADSTAHEFMAATAGASAATPGMMVRVQPSPVNLTAQTAAKTTTTLCAASAGACNTAGQYRVSWNFWGSGTACSSVTAGSVTFLLTWTDANAVVHAAVALPMTVQTGAATTATQSTFPFQTALANESAGGDFTISTNGAVIQYATGYTACTTGTGTYNLRASVMRIQ